MKLLFDENLSPKLPRLLDTLFPGSQHVRDCNLKGFLTRTFGRSLGPMDSRLSPRMLIFTSEVCCTDSLRNWFGCGSGIVLENNCCN